MKDCNSLYKTLSNKAVQLLAQRNHSSVELKKKLSAFYTKKLADNQHDFSDDAAIQIDEVIQYCISHHWLDDETYINQYIDMSVRKGCGKNRIIMELKQRGLDANLVLSVISRKDIDWEELAILQLMKKFPITNKNDIQQKAKIFQFLLYKGFNQSEINLAYSSL